MLALTGQVDTRVLGPGAFQDVDLAGAFGSVAELDAALAAAVAHDGLAMKVMTDPDLV